MQFGTFYYWCTMCHLTLVPFESKFINFVAYFNTSILMWNLARSIIGCIFEVLGRVNIVGHWRPKWMMMDDNDGLMIFCEACGPKASWHLSYRWGKPPKNLTQETFSTGDRTRACCVTGAHATACPTTVDSIIGVRRTVYDHFSVQIGCRQDQECHKYMKRFGTWSSVMNPGGPWLGYRRPARCAGKRWRETPCS